MSIKLVCATLFPKDLNLNGDQANLTVLIKRLSWQGVELEVVEATSDNLPDADLFFVGHGSLAAWNSIQTTHPQILSKLAHKVTNGSNVFAVASGALKLAELLGIDFIEAEHRSEFLAFDGVVGYINSAATLDPIVRLNNSVLTLFHGPVLAKNPSFADDLCVSFGWISESPSGLEKDEIDELARASRKTAFES